MRIHILGICGTFMGGLALLAKQQGHDVLGSDAHVYPPMSTQLEEQGIALCEGYDPQHFDPKPDLVIIGNALSRGNPMVEAVLNRGLRYCSGPQWLAEQVLPHRWVIGISGTHGKTTTSSMLAWILQHAGFEPGFLIGGVPENFGYSARLGRAPFFVVEADEYDTAFFDKRSKFVHYRPRTLVINNLEFDHADIFEDLPAIQRQFHHLVRTIPGNGRIIYPSADGAVCEVLAQGCWTSTETVGESGADWAARRIEREGRSFEILENQELVGRMQWSLLGRHNVQNALAAIAAAHHVGVSVPQSLQALRAFRGVKRRMEVCGIINGVTIYDDFAHHPTAIRMTLQGLRGQVGGARIIALVELGSNSMRAGAHQEKLKQAFDAADEVVLFKSPDIAWDVHCLSQSLTMPNAIYEDIGILVKHVLAKLRPGDHVVLMSNKDFGGLKQLLCQS